MWFMWGAAVGSFLNVVIYRMPRGMKLGKPRHSFCPKCNNRLSFSDMIPIVSWIIQGGKCRYCYAPIPVRYLMVEVVNASIWGGIWFQYLVLGWDPGRMIAYSLAASALVAIIWIDWELYLIPDQINAFLVFVGIGFNIWLFVEQKPEAVTWGMPSALAGWLLGVGVLWGIAFLGRLVFGRMAMGEGDIKMARGTGAILFPLAAGLSYGLAVVLGLIGGILQMVLRKKRAAPTGSVSIQVEGTVVSSADGSITLRLTDSSQDKILKRKEDVTLTPSDSTEFYRGEKRITAEAFFTGLAHLMPIEAHVVAEGGTFVVSAIGREQAQLARLVKSGIGYLLGFDIIGLFAVKFYEKYFGENPYEPPADLETFDAGDSMIPFGPYLALGAIIAAVFAPQLIPIVENYWRNALNLNGAGQIPLEQLGGWFGLYLRG